MTTLQHERYEDSRKARAQKKVTTRMYVLKSDRDGGHAKLTRQEARYVIKAVRKLREGWS